MTRIDALPALCALAALWLSGAAFAGAADAPPAADVPAGEYAIDRAHASVLFRVSHMGFSHYTARFTRFDATLHFDPSDPAASTLQATVDARSLETDFPDPTKVDFDAQLQGKDWLNAAEHPRMTFRSTTVTPTGPHTARVAGQLTLRGVTRPMTLETTFNGGYPGMSLDPHARIGFSAHGTLNRSDYGMTVGIPAPGSHMGVGDRVEVIIEAEFSGPSWQGAASPAQ